MLSAAQFAVAFARAFSFSEAGGTILGAGVHHRDPGELPPGDGQPGKPARSLAHQCRRNATTAAACTRPSAASPASAGARHTVGVEGTAPAWATDVGVCVLPAHSAI